MKKFIIMAAIMVLLSPFTAHAFYLVDTGTPDDSGAWISRSGDFWQHLASQFIVTDTTVVTGMQGYFYDLPNDIIPGTITVALYSGTAFDSGFNGPIPDTSAEIFSRQFQINALDHSDDYYGGWYGVNQLNETLAPGAYWIAFESRANDTYEGAMPSAAPAYLLNAAFAQAEFNDEKYNYFDPEINDGPMGIGVRVTAAPEPASMLLFSLGAMGIISKRMRKNIRKS